MNGPFRRQFWRWAGVLGALGVLMLVASPAGAQQRRVTASIVPSGGATDIEPVRLEIRIELPPHATGAPEVVPPQLDGLRNLKVLDGPSSRFATQYRNGRFSGSFTLAYTLLAESPGEALVPALDVGVDGETFTTQPLRFQVAAATPIPGPPSGGNRGGGRRRDAPQAADVFLRAELGSEEVWLGQPVSLSLTLYAGEQVSTAVMNSEPSLDEFWVEDLTVDADASSYWSRVEGRRYMAYPVRRLVLVPQTSGEFDIDPWVVQMQARVRTNDPFGIPFFGRRQTVVRKSQPLSLRVKPLPAAGRPDEFEGAVGSYELRVATDRQQTRVNDAVALRAVIEGEGFLKLSGPPAFDAPPELKVLDPKVTESFETRDGRIVSRKSWEWIVVPLAPGEMELPALRFPFFDPNAGEYRVASARPETLLVRREGMEQDVATGQAGLQVQRRDIDFIKPLRGPLSERHVRAHETTLFAVLLAAPLIWVPALILLGRHRERLGRDRGLARSRKAPSRARRRLRAARRRMDQLDSVTFHQEVARALVDYVADRFDRVAAGLTYDAADELLAARGVEPDLRRRFRSCLETCDFARFVPAAGKSERRREVLAEASGVIDALERAW